MICRVLNAFFESAIARLRRLLQTIALNVVEPTVITTANAIVLDAAIFERRTAMRTMESHQAESSHAIAKQRKLFPQQLHFDRSAFGFHRSLNATGHQYRRSIVPAGVPGPTRVKSSFSSFDSMGGFPSFYSQRPIGSSRHSDVGADLCVRPPNGRPHRVAPTPCIVHCFSIFVSSSLNSKPLSSPCR
jgi:hypothetical protein